MTTCLFQNFREEIGDYEIPKKFTYPFRYTPHPLAKIAANELQQYLIQNPNYFKYIGTIGTQESDVGKMFGVLVVQKNSGELGYLCGFSGKLSDNSESPIFVPPVVDILAEGSFFKKDEDEILSITSQLESKKISINENLEKSKTLKLEFDNLKKQESLKSVKEELLTLKHHALELKQLRKQKSIQLQNKIFNQFSFLNFNKESKTLFDCFKNETNPTPPSGSGDCAAPKLIEYAYRNSLIPIALAEFWWGAAPKSKVRNHKSFYPACNSKCRPILTHMLKGLNIDSKPL